MRLYEQYRPKSFDEVVGQDKVIRKIAALRRRGLSGRVFWIAGSSGTGKTTIARLIASEVADPISTLEIDANKLNAAMLDDIERFPDRHLSLLLHQLQPAEFRETSPRRHRRAAHGDEGVVEPPVVDVERLGVETERHRIGGVPVHVEFVAELHQAVRRGRPVFQNVLVRQNQPRRDEETRPEATESAR